MGKPGGLYLKLGVWFAEDMRLVRRTFGGVTEGCGVVVMAMASAESATFPPYGLSESISDWFFSSQAYMGVRGEAVWRWLRSDCICGEGVWGSL